MKKTRLSLEKFGKQTIRTNMMDRVNGGRESVSGGEKVSAVQEYCHPGDSKNTCSDGTCSPE